MSGTTLVTGADGHLGRKVAAALLAETDDALVLAVRTGRTAFPADRTTVVTADLTRPDALTGLGPVTRIVHAAAVTRFNVDRDTARAVNVEGTKRVAEFAHRCPDLERFVHLSTLYTAGRRTGLVAEVRHEQAGFVNEYEWSKWAAEEHLLDSGLPVSILRLPTVVAEDDSGRVGQYNALHNTLKLYYYGLLSLVPGEKRTPLALATAEFTIAAVMALMEAPARIYHVSPSETATLGEMVDAAFEVFERGEAFRRRQILRPVHCTQDSFDDMVEAAGHLRGGPIHQSLGSVAPFAHQLYLPKEFDTRALRAAWPGYAAPDPRRLIEATATHLVATRFGRTT